jgi:GNAT superfamily N-acetyltransferase
MIDWLPADAERAEELFAACPDYFQRLHGAAHTAEDIRDLLEERPPEVSEKQTWIALVRGETVGVVDFLRDYPRPGTVYVGLLMVREDRQGQGLGAILFRELARLSQGEHFRLAVLEHNKPALAFWRRMGFVATGEVKPWRGHRVILMERSYEQGDRSGLSFEI